jgi:hypothetical protein
MRGGAVTYCNAPIVYLFSFDSDTLSTGRGLLAYTLRTAALDSLVRFYRESRRSTQMNRKILFFMCFIAVVGMFLASCNNESEENRAVITVASINGNAPFFSDVLDQGDTLCVNGICPGSPGGAWYRGDDFRREDYVEVIFQNQPYHPIVLTGPNLPLSDFLVTRYRVQWRATGGASAPPSLPATYEGATSISVKSKEMSVGYILLVPADYKNSINSTLLSDINYVGPLAGTEYLMIADITFWGHEIGAQSREWSFDASVSVSFADWIRESEEF